MIGSGSKYGPKNGMCLREIGLHAQNVLTITRLIILHLGGGGYDYLIRKIFGTLKIKKLKSFGWMRRMFVCDNPPPMTTKVDVPLLDTYLHQTTIFE